MRHYKPKNDIIHCSAKGALVLTDNFNLVTCLDCISLYRQLEFARMFPNQAMRDDDEDLVN